MYNLDTIIWYFKINYFLSLDIKFRQVKTPVMKNVRNGSLTRSYTI